MATPTSKIIDSVEYRRQAWINGNVVVVEEPRRRPPRVQRRSCVLSVVPASNVKENNLPGPIMLDSHRKSANSMPFVDKSRRRESREVVIESRDHREKAAKTCPKVGSVIAELTPPPTPRIERLQTPDLPEMDQVAFCNCCRDPRQKLLCGGCGEEVELSTKWSLEKQLAFRNGRLDDANGQGNADRSVSGRS